MLPLAASFGATETHQLGSDAPALTEQSFDVVVDTTGNPEGLATALRLASREVHLKSTHGQPSCGLKHLTELVVDELTIESLPAATPSADDEFWRHFAGGQRPRVAWTAAPQPPVWLTAIADVQRGTAPDLAQHYAGLTEGLPRADVAVVDSPRQADAAIRPSSDSELSLVRPRGAVLVHPEASMLDSVLLEAVVGRGLRLSSSRCGDFRAALELMSADPELLRIGERLVTHRFAAGDLREAFKVAGSRACIKAIVSHADGGRA